MHTLKLDLYSQEDDAENTERQQYYERAWLFRIWYDFDKKYPFMCITMQVLVHCNLQIIMIITHHLYAVSQF